MHFSVQSLPATLGSSQFAVRSLQFAKCQLAINWRTRKSATFTNYQLPFANCQLILQFAKSKLTINRTTRNSELTAHCQLLIEYPAIFYKYITLLLEKDYFYRYFAATL
jgi:hypothetical protein